MIRLLNLSPEPTAAALFVCGGTGDSLPPGFVGALSPAAAAQLSVRMKTYACLNCGRQLEAAEFARSNMRWLPGARCPSCGAPVSLGGGTLVMLGLLWPFVGALVEDRAGLSEEAGLALLVALGGTRIIERLRAALRWKCEPGGARAEINPGHENRGDTS